MASVTITPVQATEGSDLHVLGGLSALVADLAFTGSLTSGGDDLDFSSFFKVIGGGTVYFVVVPSVVGYSFEYDYDDKQISVFQGDNDNASDGPSVEVTGSVPATLAAVTVRALVLGR